MVNVTGVDGGSPVSWFFQNMKKSSLRLTPEMNRADALPGFAGIRWECAMVAGEEVYRGIVGGRQVGKEAVGGRRKIKIEAEASGGAGVNQKA